MNTSQRTGWDDYWPTVGNETYLSAKRLAELSPRVQHFFERFIHPVDEELDDGQVLHDVHLDWDRAAAAIDDDGFSSTERQLAHLVAALTSDEHPINLRTTLGSLGSWEMQVWAILVEWGTDARATATLTDAGRANAARLADLFPQDTTP